jgi:hypothetical protein
VCRIEEIEAKWWMDGANKHKKDYKKKPRTWEGQEEKKIWPNMSAKLLRNLLERRIDQHVHKAVEKPTEEKIWSTCVKSYCETCWKDKLINMRAKKVVEKAVDTDQTMCGESRYTYSTAELAAGVCVMYLFRRRTCWQSVRDVLIPAQNFLSECVRYTYSLIRRGALCTGFTLISM